VKRSSTINERTYLLSDCLGCPERDSESAASEPPWFFVSSWCFSDREAMAGSTTGGQGEILVEAGKGKVKEPNRFYTKLVR